MGDVKLNLEKAIEMEWERVQYQCKAAREHYITCQKVAKKSAGHTKDLEEKNM
jgi:hypothetical protein